MLLFKRMYKEAGERADMLSIREARWSFWDAAQELHRLYSQGEAFAVLALVDVEARQLADAVEAVADRVTVGEEIARCPDGRGVVAEVGDQGLNQLGPVAGVVVDDGLQCLAVEGLEFLGVLLEHPEEEFVCPCLPEGRDAGGPVDAVSDLERYPGLRIGLGELGGVLLEASDPAGDRKVGEEAFDVALYPFGQQVRLLRQLFWTFAFLTTQKEDNVIRAWAEEEIREELAGLQAYRICQASLELLNGGLLRSAACEVAGEVVYVDDHYQGPAGDVGAEVSCALQEELDRAVMATHEVVHEVSPGTQFRLQAYTLFAEFGFEDSPGPVQEHHIFGPQVAAFEIDPEVPCRGAGSDGGPEQLAVSDPPALDGHGEVPVG